MALRCIGAFSAASFTSQPGVSYGHDEHLSDRRVGSTLSSKSWPPRPQKNVWTLPERPSSMSPMCACVALITPPVGPSPALRRFAILVPARDATTAAETRSQWQAATDFCGEGALLRRTRALCRKVQAHHPRQTSSCWRDG